MKLKRASLITKLIVLAILCYMIVTILSLQTDIAAYEETRDTLASEAEILRAENDRLRIEIESSDDPAFQEEIARDRLGLVKPGEKVFIDTTN